MTARLEVEGVTKRFPGVVANDDVSFSVEPGEIHALLGENGAGKSTLVKMIFGVLKPDAGEIRIDGMRHSIESPHDARALGIGMVFQHFLLFEAMSVMENVVLGLDRAGSMHELAAELVTVSRRYGLPLEPDRPVHTLSVGERQRIEIVRCLLQQPRLLIMDEPTSVLTPQEVDKLFVTLRRLADEGCSILYISHKLDEVRALCERASVLRRGKLVATCDPREETSRSLAAAMVGTQVKPPSKRESAQFGGPVLEVSGLSARPSRIHGVALSDINFAVRSGEIFGIAGVAGNGQNELVEFLSGERPAPTADSIRILGHLVGALGATRRRDVGLCYIPEERNGHGAVGALSLIDNAILGAWRRQSLIRRHLVLHGKAAQFARSIVTRFDVRTTSVQENAGTLSGGNLQKFIVGREVLQDPSILIAVQPTWGLDAGAASEVHQALLDLAEEGCAILVISQDLDEIISLSDRMAVMNGGRLSHPLATGEADIDTIGLLMGGLHGAAPAPEALDPSSRPASEPAA